MTRSIYTHLTDIPGVTPAMLDAQFWLEHLPNPYTPLLTPDAITDFNRRVSEVLSIPPVLDLPDTLSAEAIYQAIDLYPLPTRARYGGDGAQLDERYFEHLSHNAHPDLPAQVSIQWGVVTRRTSLRSFPTSALATSEPLDLAFDMFQETALDIGWPVAILALSRDEKWAFALTPHYWGWLAREDIATGTRAAVATFTQPSAWVVVTASQGLVGHGDGGLTPQMGTTLPLSDETDAFYRVQIPCRGADGGLHFDTGSIPRASGQFHKGYLPLTLRTLFTQGFSLLGEPYAWGCSRMGIFGRDCSRFLKDIYATAGLILPRNGDEQRLVGRPVLTFTPEQFDEAREGQIATHAQPGDILVTPGHVMLYLGAIDGIPYILHDVGGRYMCVLVSTLRLNEDLPTGSILRQLTHVVRP